MNIADSTVCPGEEIIYNCVSTGNSQRWIIRTEGREPVEHFFTSEEPLQTIHTDGLFRFMLISTAHNHFESTVSVEAMVSLDNTMVECTGFYGKDTSTVHIVCFKLNF